MSKSILQRPESLPLSINTNPRKMKEDPEKQQPHSLNKVIECQHSAIFVTITNLRTMAPPRSTLGESSFEVTTPSAPPQSHSDDDKAVSDISMDEDEDTEMVEEEDTTCFCRGRGKPPWIGCDGDDCATEWYHLECLNMTKVPRGRWLCPACRPRKATEDQESFQTPAVVPVFPYLGQAKSNAAAPTISQQQDAESKKTPARKEKPRWKGWLELSSGEERR